MPETMSIKDKLKKYRCHKIVHACPMTAGEFRRYKPDSSSRVPGQEDRPGYLVVYSMGTPDEYESWSPKKAFDEGYLGECDGGGFGDRALE